MTASTDRYRTVFSGELVQKTGLSTGGRDGDLHADAVLARDGLDRPVLRGTGLAGALLATLDDLGVQVPPKVSRRLPSGNDEKETAESLWLVHHAHLVGKDTDRPMVRPNVAIHPWTGAAVDGLYFSTEVLPRGTRWRFIVETDDWRESVEPTGETHSANTLLALALHEWVNGRCWLGRSPARGLGWARLENLKVYKLDTQAADRWPDSRRTSAENLIELGKATPEQGVQQVGLKALFPTERIKRANRWRIYRGEFKVGESALDENSYGLDTLSTLARDFPADQNQWKTWREDKTIINRKEVPADIELDSAPAWTQGPDGELEFMVPGSAIRGAFRSGLSAHWRRAGHEIWAPNGRESEPENSDSDLLLPLFGSINHDSNLLVSDAWPVEDQPQLYVQELHAEDEFTQGPYGSSKFNRPCLVSGQFEFEIAIREAAMETAAGCSGVQKNIVDQVIRAINELGAAGMLPIGGGVWRGHGWVRLKL